MANLYQVRKEIEECFDEETGEVLDVDAITGGFNLQAAWTMAYVVAKNI